MQVTICGGGNAAHTLAVLISARPGFEVNVYTSIRDEVQRWRQGIEERGGITLTDQDGATVGRPRRVSDDPATVIPGSQLLLLALPAFAHEIVLCDIAPHLDHDAWVGVLPARGGLDWSARDILTSGEKSLVLFGLQTLPWACRIQRYGQAVEVLGTKAEVDLAVRPAEKAIEVSALLSDLLRVPMCPVSSFLGLTLAGTGQLIHPGVMYGLFHDWDGCPYAEAPLFYQGIDARTADTLQRLSDEVQSLRALLERRYPKLDLASVRSLHEWTQRSYSDHISDSSTLQNCFVTNRSYAGLRAPMRATDDGLVPDFEARYLSEDVPFGLVVLRGIAELADLPAPMIDRVISWAQTQLGKEYLVDGKLKGRDLMATRAPQRFGFGSLDEIVMSEICGLSNWESVAGGVEGARRDV